MVGCKEISGNDDGTFLDQGWIGWLQVVSNNMYEAPVGVKV